MTRVRDWMTVGVRTVGPDDPLEALARRLAARAVRHLPVVDADGRLVGLVTDHAVLRHGRLVGDDGDQWLADRSDDLRARDVMVPPEVVAVADDEIAALLDRLADSPQDFAVVVDGDRRPIGLFTEHDGVRLAAEQLDAGLSTRELSSAPVWSVPRDAPAERAVQLLRERGVRHVLVLDGEALFGVLSLRDLLGGGAADGERITAGELVRPGPVHVLEEGGSLARGAQKMAREKVGCLPVVTDGARPVAVVTRTDLLRALAARVRHHAIQTTRPPPGS